MLSYCLKYKTDTKLNTREFLKLAIEEQCFYQTVQHAILKNCEIYQRAESKENFK